MAGYTDAAFRLLCKEYGADFTVTELASSEGLVRNSQRTHELTYISPRERPAAIQIFGSNVQTMAKAAWMLEERCDAIDVNLGCPALSVTRVHGGAELLKDPKKIREIIEAIASTVKISVTAKMRLGINSIANAVKIAKAIEKSGAQAITIHGRTLKQGYSGQANWEEIKKVKQELAIPVFGNGDITSYSKASEATELSKVNGVLIGRGALGNPFIFTHCKKQKDSPVTPKEQIYAFTRYLEIRNELKLRNDLKQIKTQAICFIRNSKNASLRRLEVTKAKSLEEVNENMHKWLEK